MQTQTISQNKVRYFALIPAGGVGNRMGASTPKQYLPLLDKLILQHVIEAFYANQDISRIFVVVNANDSWIDELMASYKGNPILERLTILRCGGETRRDSVLAGLKEMYFELTSTDWVLVHDAARPGLTPELIKKLMEEIGDDPVGGLLALPVVDTVKKQFAENVETISRDGLWLAQTPQMFRYFMLLDALQNHPNVTDDASAMEAAGFTPRLVEGHLCNSKVTQASDLELVRLFLTAQADSIK